MTNYEGKVESVSGQVIQNSQLMLVLKVNVI